MSDLSGPERRRRRDELLEQLLELAPAARASFLEDVCGSDPAMRADLEGLLAFAHRMDSRFLETAAGAIAPSPLSAGARLGRYVIERSIGVGGMSAVYLARDPGVDRSVAIKVLAPSPHDREWRDRFFAELRILGRINHDHVVRMYDFGDADGQLYIVTELLEGEDLGKAIAQGRTGDVARKMDIARQVALALRDVHAEGIVHRDLKPGNVFLDRSGRVKLIDFGISRSENLQGTTQAGVLRGTPEYMPPERIKGEAVTPLLDVYSYGVLLFELFSGRRPFTGNTDQVLYQVLHESIPTATLRGAAPDAIVDLIERTTAKNPQERVQSFADIVAAFDQMKLRVSIPSAVAAPRATHSSRSKRVLLIAVTGLVVALAVAVAFFLKKADVRPRTATRFTILPPKGSDFSYGVSVSPDGNQLAAAVVTGTQYAIWTRALDGLEFRRVAGTENGYAPFWSPDGRWIGFVDHSNGSLRKVPSAGGTPVTLVEGRGGGGGLADWDRNGQIIYASKGSLFKVSADGGPPVKLPVQSSDASASVLDYPSFLPGLRLFLFGAAKRSDFSGGIELHVGSIGSAESSRVLTTDSPAVYSSGYILYVRSNQLLAQRFGEASLKPVGSPIRIGDYASSNLYPNSDAALSSRSSDAVVLQTAYELGAPLTWFDRQGRAVASLQEPSQGKYLWPSISPDQSEIAVHHKNPQTNSWDIWVLRGSEAPSRLTFSSARNTDAVWSPDGREIAYVTQREGRFAIHRRRVRGDAAEQLIYQGVSDELILTDWSPDGASLLYWTFSDDPGVWLLPLQDKAQPKRITAEGTIGLGGRFSPDGNWIAYAGVESAGEPHIYVQPVGSRNSKVQINADGALHPQWRRDGKELYYVSSSAAGLGTEKVVIKVVDISISAAGIRAGNARTLFDIPVAGLQDNRRPYAATPDGQRFLFRPATGPQTSLTVIENWTALLAK